MRMHPGNNPYKCQFCQSSFAETGHLNVHMRTHTGENPYTCQLCQKSFPYDCRLRRHMRIHTGEKPYKCQLCDKSYAESGHLKRHMRIHTGEKPYKCQLCQNLFSQSGHLKIHMRTHLTTHGRTHATVKQSTCNKPWRAKSSSSEKHFQLQRVIQPHDLRMESESVANISQDEISFLGKSFGCGLCGEILEIEKDFLEHCFSHRFSPPDDLLVAMCADL